MLFHGYVFNDAELNIFKWFGANMLHCSMSFCSLVICFLCGFFFSD